MRFADRVVLVTGAASGIGAATAALFRSEAATVIGVDRVEGPDVVPCDVTHEAEVGRVVEQTIADHGRIDVVCNVAGILRRGPIESLRLETWKQVIDVNLTGPFIVCRATLPYLVEVAGCIVNVASISGLHGQIDNTAYCASKGGLIQLTRALAVEFADRLVRVNCVCPGGVDTPMIARPADVPAPAPRQASVRMAPLMPGLIEADEVAGTVAFLASDAARSISGSALVVDRATLAS